MTKTLPTVDLQISTLIDEFLDEAARKPTPTKGSVVFALDATMSRQPTWDMAAHLQAQMFAEVASLGALDVKMIYFRGAHGIDAECRSSQWLSGTTQVAKFMTSITCRGGLTQIGRVLDHVLRESEQRKINAVIYVGDCVEEPRLNLVPLARRLADQGVPIFLFQEGRDSNQIQGLAGGVGTFASASVVSSIWAHIHETTPTPPAALFRARQVVFVGLVWAVRPRGPNARSRRFR